MSTDDSEAKSPEQKDKEHEDAEAFKMKAKADLANEDDSADPSAAEPDPTAAEADPVSPESPPMTPPELGIFTQNEDPKDVCGAPDETEDPATPGDSFVSSKPDEPDLRDTPENTPRVVLNTADLSTANPLGASVVSL